MDALLLHGLGGGPADMDSLAQELATMGVACHAPCLPGHGTGWEAFVRSHWNQWSAAAHEAYAALAGQSPEPPLLAGYSLGGLLALDTLFWAREAGLPAPRCLLVFAAPLYWSSRPGRLGERALRWRLAWKAWRQPVEICSPRSEAARETAPWQGHEWVVCWRHMAEIAHEQPRLRALLPACDVPVCYVQLWHDSSCRSAVTAGICPCRTGKAGTRWCASPAISSGPCWEAEVRSVQRAFSGYRGGIPGDRKGMRLSSLQAGGAEEGRSFPKAACAGTSLFRLSSLYGSFPGGMAAQAPAFLQ